MKETNKKGFTLLEVLVALALLAILFAIILPRFSGDKELQTINSTSQDIVSALDKARSETLASVNATTYGVYFTPTQIIVFSGTSYTASPSNAIETISISSPATISDVYLNSTDATSGTVYFNRLNGLPSASGTITVSTTNYSQTINILNTGFSQAAAISKNTPLISGAPPSIGSVTTHTAGAGWLQNDSFSHTVVSGTDLLLVVLEESGCQASSVTYGGTPLTKIYSTSGANGECHEYWALSSSKIPTGTNTISVSSYSWTLLAEAAVNVVNASLTNPYGSKVSNDPGGYYTSISLSAPSASTDLVLSSLSLYDGSGYNINTSSTGQVKIWSNRASFNRDFLGSYSPGTGGTVTASWTYSSALNIWAYGFESILVIHGP